MVDNGYNPVVSKTQWFCVALFEGGQTTVVEADTPADFDDILKKAVIAWVDFRTNDFDNDFRLASLLGFSDSLITALTSSPRNLYEDNKTEMAIRLPSIQINGGEQPEVKANYTFLFLKKNCILTLHPMEVDRRYARLRRYADIVLKKLPASARYEDLLTQLLMRLIETNNDRNFEHLRQIEEHGDTLNKNLMDSKTPRDTLGPQIYGMKHALMVYLDSLWESVDVIRQLRYGDADLISDSQQLLDKMGILAEDVNRQIGLAEHMSDVLASGLEVMQSIYNNQLQILNNKLALVVAYLTIIGTAVLVPNTLATIFGNSAFNMDSSDIGWYTVLLVVSTAIATFASFWWVKKSGWIPKKPE
jgi:magnesium transporter